MIFLLDTNAVIGLSKNNIGLNTNLRLHRPQDIVVSTIIMHELYLGAYKGQRTAYSLATIEGMEFNVLDFDKEDARRAGELRAFLAGSGTPIGPYDILIAGQALARSLTLITRNTREFERVKGLSVENWEG